MKPIVVIPARGGSKRIPKKNISIISGEPALGLLISKLDSTNLFGEIIVSTDDADINKIAIDFGAKVSIRQKQELSDDFTPSEEVIRSFIVENQLADAVTPIFCIYPLAVLIQQEDLVEALNKLVMSPNRFVISAGLLEVNPLRHTFRNLDPEIEILFPENNLKRSQDLELAYYDAGMFYLAHAKTWLDPNKYWYNNNALTVLIPSENCIDVDTPADLEKLRKRYDEVHR
jgi:CMP-N-acetylneuraminic acid synthetase